MLKNVLISLITLVLATVAVASTALSGASTSTGASATPTIALVNEDQPATFNGTKYLFGTDFVRLVSNDSQYNWQVVSRAVAENAYADKTVSAVIVLPRSFSRDILTFEDINPVKAAIDYKLAGGDDLSRLRLQGEVSAILRDFNTRVVKMYFASVASNISGAQVKMSSLVASESGLVDELSTSHHPDLKQTHETYSSSVSLAGVLQTLNSGWIASQNGFTNSTTTTLSSISESLGRQQPTLNDYFAQQQQIAQTNVTNGNMAISGQGASDKNFYDQAFADHISQLNSGDGSWSGFSGFSSADADGKQTGVLRTVVDTVARYNALAVDYNARVDDMSRLLEQQQTDAAEAIRQLQALETTLLKEYFTIEMPVDDANYSIDTGDSVLMVDLARQALAQKLADGLGADPSNAATVATFEQRITKMVENIPTDPAEYAGLLADLEANTGFKTGDFLRRLDLIRKYRDEKNIAPATLNLVSPVTGGAAAPAARKSLPVTVPAGARFAVESFASDALQPDDVEVGVGSPTPACPTLTPECVSVDRAKGTATIDNTGGTEPVAVTLTYAIDLEGLSGNATVAYTAQDLAPTAAAAPASLGVDLYMPAPANPTAERIGGDDFAAITSYLGDTQTVADLLLFLYGDPHDTLGTFSQRTLAGGPFPGASTESMFNRYGTIDASKIAARLSDADVERYQKLGQQHIGAIVTQIAGAKTRLRTMAANADTLSRLHLSETYFSDAVAQLEGWYTKAMTSIGAAPGQWDQKSNTVIRLNTIPWSGQEPGKAELYLDDRTGPALYTSLSELISSTSQSAEGVAASARIITDNSSDFDTLVAGVTKAKGDTQAVLDAMQGTITAGTGDLAVSSEYSKQFAQVLSNTRATGTDPATIYDAFANPVTTTDRTPVTESPVAGGFDYRWLVMFAAGSLIGALGCWLVGRRKKKPAA